MKDLWDTTNCDDPIKDVWRNVTTSDPMKDLDDYFNNLREESRNPISYLPFWIYDHEIICLSVVEKNALFIILRLYLEGKIIVSRRASEFFAICLMIIFKKGEGNDKTN